MRRTLMALLMAMVPATLAAQQASPAPRPGHPLDPADVAILSGSGQTTTSYGAYAGPYVAYPGPYVTYSANAPLFGQSVFAPVSTATQPPIVPLAFGRVGRRPVALFSVGNVGVPPLLFVQGNAGLFVTPRSIVFGVVGRR